jgi:glutathione S-transferase
MPELKLFVAPASAPCRAVLLHHHLLGQAAPTLEVVPLNLGQGEHKQPEVLRANPLHTVPTLVSPWGPLSESRAIMRFMESLCPEPVGYPTGVYHRAVVDRLLDWDLGSLYRVVSSIVYPQVFSGVDPNPEDLDKLNDATRFLDQKQLGDGREFLTGAQWTIADISCSMTLSLLRLAGLEVADVPRMAEWQRRVAALDGHAEIDEPFQQWIASLSGDVHEPAAAEATPDEAPADEAPADDQPPQDAPKAEDGDNPPTAA